MTPYHVAELNIGRLVAPIDDPRIAAFVERLDEINALAESSPGFIWRLKDDSGNATSIKVYDDPLMILNLSVWESVEALRAFTYQTAHTEPMRSRLSWFEKYPGAYFVMWWIPAGHLPGIDEAKLHLECLERNGPTADAFTFTRPFLPPDA